MNEAQPLNAWERGIAAMGRRMRAPDGLEKHVVEEARSALRQAWSDEEKSASEERKPTPPGLQGWLSRWRIDEFRRDDELVLGADEFDPTRIATRGHVELDDWYVWCGSAALVALTGDDGRRRARLAKRMGDAFSKVADHVDRVLWKEEALVALRDAYVDIDQRISDAGLRQKARHLGMFATGLALGARRARGLAPRLFEAMDPHDVKSMQTYMVRGLSSRRASASSSLRRALTEVQLAWEAMDE